jgi:hypothetical protein
MILEHSNPHTVYNKQEELLQFGNLRKIHHIVLTLPLDCYFWASDTTILWSLVLQQEEFGILISAMTIVKTSPR